MNGHATTEANLLAVVYDAFRAVDETLGINEAMQRGLETVAVAADLRYLGVALLDLGMKLDYRYEWASEESGQLTDDVRRAVQIYVADAMPRLMRREIVDCGIALIVPFAVRGSFAGFVAAASRLPWHQWSETEKQALGLASEVLIARLTLAAVERDLRAREKQLHLMLRATNDAVYEWTLGSDEVLWNDAVLDLTGDTAETFQSSRSAWMDRIVAEDRATILPGLDLAIARNEEVWSDQYRIYLGDGSIAWVNDRACVLRNSSGRPVKVAGSIMDVTSCRKAEEARLLSEEKYHRLIDQADDLIVSVDNDGCITSMNRAFDTITEWNRSSWIGREVFALMEPHDAAAARQMMEKVRERAGAVSHELRLKTSKDIVEMDATISPVIERGEVAGTTWICRDVTERNREHRERIELSKRIEMLLESTYEAIIATDAEGHCYLVNRSASRILGYEPEDLIGRSFHEFVHPRHDSEQWAHARTLCPLGALIEQRVATPLAEEMFTRRDGTMIPVQFAGSPIEGSIGGAVVTFSDASERKLLESELERANRMAGLGHVAATIAHEFNNVLMGIQPFVEIIGRRGGINISEPLTRIGQSIRRGKRIALEILRFSQPLPTVMESLQVQDWLRRFAVEARGILGPSREVALDMPEEPLFMKADNELLQQAFVNLVTNARDAMPAGGTLRIAVERCTAQSAHGALISPDRFLRIAVSDTGNGMSEETLKHLFEPLFTTKKGQGSGLGLAIVHQIVTAHGGYIFAESQPRTGSTFLVFLAIAEAPEPKLEPAAPPAIAAAGKPRVLLVEDDEAVADGITGVLQVEGIECEVVALGGAAADAVERFHPSVVVLDVGLPDMDGREVFRRLRERWPDLPIIFSTGHAGMEAAAGERHHVAVLQKPYEADDLLRCIAEVTAMPIEDKS